MTRCSCLLATFVAALVCLACPAHAANKTWTGAGATRTMSEGANWSDGLAPARGDRLIFPCVAQTYVQNDFTDGSFDGITFGDLDCVYTVYGNPLALTGAPTVVVNGRVTAFVVLDISFPASYVRITATGIPTPNDRRPVLQFAPGHQMRFSGGLLEAVAEVGAIEFRSDITETAPTSIQVQGVDISFDGDNSFSGTVEAFGGGILGVYSARALGTSSGATYVKGDTHLSISNPVNAPEMVVAEPFVLDNTPDVSVFGSIEAVSNGWVRLTGDIAVLTPQVIQANTLLQFDGRMSGSGHVEIDSPDGNVSFTHGENSLDGGITVSRGTLGAPFSFALGFMNSVDVESAGTVDLGFTFQALTQFTCRGGKVKGVVGAVELAVRDAVTLAGCSFEPGMWPGFIPQSGQVLTVIRNDSAAPIDGEFNFLPEGAVLDVNGVRTTATYHAGSGNDFAFVAEVLPAATLLPWGSLQSLELGVRALVPLAVQGFDRYGRAAPNTRITFTSPPGCGTFGGSQTLTVMTDANGFATTAATGFTAGNVSQVCIVQAQADAGGSASFEMHLYSPADVTITPTPASLSTVANQPFGLRAEVRGLNGMSLPNLRVEFQQIVHGNSNAYWLPQFLFTSPLTSDTAVQLTANEKAGNYDIVVSVGAVSVTVPVSQKVH